MKVSEVAALAGVSIRTLHHYDAIGLLVPHAVTESGYREYPTVDLEALQQILFFRELGFPLQEIRSIMLDPTFDRHEALELQHGMLLDKRKKLDAMIHTIEKTIRHGRGELTMSDKDRFEGFDFSKNPYEQEARERWGDEAVDQANEKAVNFTDSQKEQYNAIFRELAAVRHLAPESAEAQEGIHKWYLLLRTMGDYSLEMFRNLGQMYVDDPRFTKNIDQFGDGLARFMCDAMAVYAGE